MNELPILQLIYTSVATVPFSTQQLQELLQKARTYNQNVGISGMLVHDDGYFMQVLEGPESVLAALYEKIEQDTRHTTTRLLYRDLEKNKEFEEWSMGFVDTSGTAAKAEGFIPYSSLKTETLEKTRAKKLLRMFQEGSWRAKVSY